MDFKIFDIDDLIHKPTLLQRVIFPFLKTHKNSTTYGIYKVTIYSKLYKGKLYIVKHKVERVVE